MDNIEHDEARIISTDDGGWRVEWAGTFGPHSHDCKTWKEVLKELDEIFCLEQEKDSTP